MQKRSGREAIVVTELPYQVNKARLLERIAELVKEKKIEGIAQDGLRDESDKDGMRIVIELKRDAHAEVLLNNLYQHTQMQQVFGINMVALVDGQPLTAQSQADPGILPPSPPRCGDAPHPVRAAQGP